MIQFTEDQRTGAWGAKALSWVLLTAGHAVGHHPQLPELALPSLAFASVVASASTAPCSYYCTQNPTHSSRALVKSHHLHEAFLISVLGGPGPVPCLGRPCLLPPAGLAVYRPLPGSPTA